MTAIERAEQRARFRLERAPAAEGEHLVEQRQRIAHAAFGRSRDRLERAGLVLDLLGHRDLHEPLEDLRRRQPAQMKLQAARQHRDRQLLRVGRREQELDVRRRLLERLEQRVERMRRQHVHFVDQVDLVAAARRRILHVVEQLAGVVHLGARGGVDFEQIDEASCVDVATRAAFAARPRRDTLLAVQRLGEDPRDRRLADAARAR